MLLFVENDVITAEDIHEFDEFFEVHHVARDSLSEGASFVRIGILVLHRLPRT